MTTPLDPAALPRKGLNLLIVFHAVAETRSVTAAADRLSLTQSALSHALRRLRDLFDDQLFVRGHNGLTLTPRAEALVQPIQELLASAEALLHPQDFDPLTFDGEIRLGITEACLLLLDLPTLARLRNAAPRLRLSFDAPGTEGDRRVEEGQFDIGIWYADAVSPTLRSTELFADRYVGVAHPNHALAQVKAPITANAYRESLHFHLDLPGLRQDPLLAALERHDVQRTVAVRTTSFLPTFPPLAQASLVGAVPSHLATTARRMGIDLGTFELPFEIEPLSFRMVWSDRTDKDPASSWLRTMLAEAFAAATLPSPSA